MLPVARLASRSQFKPSLVMKSANITSLEPDVSLKHNVVAVIVIGICFIAIIVIVITVLSLPLLSLSLSSLSFLLSLLFDVVLSLLLLFTVHGSLSIACHVMSLLVCCRCCHC